MGVKEFKIWLASNGYNQKRLAKRLGITETTVSTYATKGQFPVMFVLALHGLTATEGTQNNA